MDQKAPDRADPTPNPRSIRFGAGLLAVCLVVFVVIVQFATPRSAAVPGQPLLSPVEMHALAQQATLRVAASSCGEVTRGSGVIIDGSLITNAHVARQATEIKVDQPIDPSLIPVIGRDAGSDLASAVAPAGVSVVLASREAVTAEAVTGRSVTLAGHAGGGHIEIQVGVVSARVPGAAYGYGVDVLLIDAETRGGYSGGPVLDEFGNVIGILSGFDRATGLSLAIPADVVADFLIANQSTTIATRTEGSTVSCPG